MSQQLLLQPIFHLNPLQIEVDGIEYSSTEHFYQHHKCIAAGNITAEVLLSLEQKDALAYGAQVKQQMSGHKLKEEKQ